MGSRLHERFVRYCEVRSPTGEEREIADTLAAELRAMGLEVSEDGGAEAAEERRRGNERPRQALGEIARQTADHL